MANEELPILPKNWKELGYKKVSKEKENNNINVEDIEVGCVYRNYVKDLVKILEINKEKQQILLYNISGSFKQWLAFKNIALIEKLY